MEFLDNVSRQSIDKIGVVGRHYPTVEIKGPIILHDMCCPVYFHLPAVYNKDVGIFFPSKEAQRDGYIMIRARNGIIRKLLLWLFGIR
jgi:hypothetical protein